MRPNPVKAKLLAGEPVVGAFCNIPSPAVVELLGLLGYDFVIIDAEHGSPDLETCEHMVRAAEATSITPIVRVAVNLSQNILRYLDTGALGVQVPMVNTRAEAREVVSACRYPPLGKRGLAGVRASGYSVSGSLADYVEQANRETLVIVQVETAEAVKNAREIATLPGIDLVFMGPTDLSSSLGYPGQVAHPEVLRAIEAAGREALSAGKAVGTIARDAEAYAYWRQRGFLYLCTTVTSLLAGAGKEYLQECRARDQRNPPPWS